MKRLVAVVLCAVGAADAEPALSISSDAPVDEVTELARLELGDSVMLDHAGATAAFSVDAEVVEVAAREGRVLVTARGVGTTTISVVTAAGVVSFPLTVVARPRWTPGEGRAPASPKWTVWQGRYESATSRVTNSLEMVDASPRRTLRAYAVNVVRLDEVGSDDVDARTAVPALSLEWRTKRHEVVVFDKLIDHSPLTLDGVTVRGVHVRSGGLELHTGVTSPLLYQNVFLTTQQEVALGASYELRAGRSSVTPSVYAFPSTPATGGTEGTMGSLLYRYASRDDRLQLRSELGWGGVLGAAGELTYQDRGNRAWIAARHQPRGFAALGLGRPLGTMLDAVWTAEPTKRFTFNLATTAARYQTGDSEQAVATASSEARIAVVRHLAASLGLAAGQFRPDPMQERLYSITVPAGLHVEGKHAAASAIYRYQQNSARNRGGHGGRLSLRARGGALYGSTFVDVQQEAATLELVLRQEPGLAQALAELGLTAATPDDLARLLRENATLNELGYVEGATLSFAPWRAQAGAELAWLPRDKTRQQLRLRMLLDHSQTVTNLRDTVSASASYERGFGKRIDASAMASWWSREDAMSSRTNQWSMTAGLRVKIDAVPRLRSRRPREIAGIVLADGAPMPGVRVRLAGRGSAVSDATGRFSFGGVDEGSYRVEAELPDDAYFTGPSHVDVEAGGAVRFTLARAQAHATGAVRDDAGTGLAGVTVVARGAVEHRATTDSSGHYRFAVGAGAYELAALPESLGAGYDATALAPRTLRLDAGSPARADFVVRANRSIAGTLRGAAGSVTLVELGRAGVLDSEGRYVFRGLPAGTYTVEAVVGDRRARRVIVLPAAPTAIRGVDFGH